MKKYIILSVNENEDYLYFTPIVVWAWRKIGWNPIVMYHRKKTDKESIFRKLEQLTMIDYSDQHHFDTQGIGNIDGYRSDTLTQVARIYGWMSRNIRGGDDYVMTGDIDMLPLSNYWNPTKKQTVRGQEVDVWQTGPTVWGHDLTGFGHYPICYIGMNTANWNAVTLGDGNYDLEKKEWKVAYGDIQAAIKKDLDKLPQAKDPDFYKYWFTDQDLITQRLNEFGKENITFVNRGQGTHGYARGRVDRGSGGWVLDQPELIDAHLEQQTHHKREKIERLYKLLGHVWPNEDLSWFHKYTEDFRKLTGHTG